MYTQYGTWKWWFPKGPHLCLKQSSGSSQYLPFRHLKIPNLKGRVGGPLHLAIHDSQVRFFQAACTRSRPGSQAHFTITQSIYNNSTELIDQFDDSCLLVDIRRNSLHFHRWLLRKKIFWRRSKRFRGSANQSNSDAFIHTVYHSFSYHHDIP